MNKTQNLLDKFNLLHDSKQNGSVSSTLFSETLNDVNSLYFTQCLNGKHTKEEMDSYGALLHSDSRAFSYNHVGLDKVVANYENFMFSVANIEKGGEKQRVM